MASALDAILAKYTAAGDDTKDKLLGAAFVVVGKDGVLYSSSAGRIDLAADARPWAVDTFTYVASMTKLITCTAVMQLVERGAVGLDHDMRKIVPRLADMQILRGFDGDEQPILEDNTTPVTLRMLLTHTVGLGYDVADPDLTKWRQKTNSAATNLYATLDGFTTPFKFTPGEGWNYGTAIDWAGQVLEKVTGQRLGEYLSENVFGPLGMQDTGFWPDALPHVAERTAAWQYRGDDGSSLAPGPAPRNPAPDAIDSGGAGLWTTAKDYGIFLRALLGGELIGPETLDAMFAPQLDGKQTAMLKEVADFFGSLAVEFAPGMELNHGLAGCLNMSDAPGKRRKGSLQWSGMCNSHWWMDRETGVAAALIVQSIPHGDPVVTKLYDELERAVYGRLLRQQA
ncbi:beta-lactamase [Colletotrichum graminicola M1.001]|uniref:Beta-lactamase n=1 Tax=Colletotrichum graminicola (strain M1.001 / M2 / FGSC 10212) TaxID=645133 RepID=E3QQD7_COLGM|nr:beta-lactamase [Colletotrichum graminicola M1.001]EFQ33075.1 beta-lactamase [Colletotrichum graminicola M1.001]